MYEDYGKYEQCRKRRKDNPNTRRIIGGPGPVSYTHLVDCLDAEAIGDIVNVESKNGDIVKVYVG